MCLPLAAPSGRAISTAAAPIRSAAAWIKTAAVQTRNAVAADAARSGPSRRLSIAATWNGTWIVVRTVLRTAIAIWTEQRTASSIVA